MDLVPVNVIRDNKEELIEKLNAFDELSLKDKEDIGSKLVIRTHNLEHCLDYLGMQVIEQEEEIDHLSKKLEKYENNDEIQKDRVLALLNKPQKTPDEYRERLKQILLKRSKTKLSILPLLK